VVGVLPLLRQQKIIQSLRVGFGGKVVPRPWASSTMRSPTLGVRRCGECEATPASSKVRAITPLAATMNSSMSEVARFLSGARSRPHRRQHHGAGFDGFQIKRAVLETSIDPCG